jgi:hypothetical protein
MKAAKECLVPGCMHACTHAYLKFEGQHPIRHKKAAILEPTHFWRPNPTTKVASILFYGRLLNESEPLLLHFACAVGG